MQKLIKVTNHEKAQLLVSNGFNYIRDRINGQTVYAFFVSDELMRFVRQHLDDTEFFLDSNLRF